MSVNQLSRARVQVCRLIASSAVLFCTVLASGQQPRSPVDAVGSFYGHVRDAVGVAVAPDGKSVAVAGAEDKVLLWSVPDGKRLASVPVDARMVIALAYSPDGRFLAVSVLPANREQSNFILVLEGQSLKPHVRIPLANQTAYSLAWSPDSSLLAAACGFSKQFVGIVRLFEPSERRESGVLTCSEQSGVPKHVQFSPDGATIAVGGNGGVCELWDVKEHKLRWWVKAHTSIIYGLAFSPGGETVATISEDGLEVNLWDTASGKRSGQLVTRGKLAGVAFSPSGKTIAVASHIDRQQVVLWNAATRKPQVTLSLGSGLKMADHVAFSGQGNLLVAEADNTIFCWNITKLEDSQFAKQLRLTQFPSLKSLYSRIQANPNATEFALTWDVGSLHDEEIGLVAELKKLRKLTVSSYSAKAANWAESDSFLQLQELPEFEELVLQNVALNSLRGPSRLSRLKRLSLEGDCRITSWLGLGSFEGLEELDLRGSGITDQEINNLSQLKSLKRIRLAGTVERPTGRRNYLTSQALASFAPLAALEVLEVDGDLINSEAGRHLMQLVNLRELKISGTSIGDGCAEAVARMSKLEVAQLSTITDTTLLALAKLPNLRKVTAHGSAYSDFALEQLGQLQRLEELRLYGYWTPYNALKFARDLKSMHRNELRTYELMRCLAAEGEYLSWVRAAQRNTALKTPFTPAAIPKFTGPAVGGDNPIHPRYDEHVASKQSIFNMYLKLDNAKLDAAKRIQILEEETLKAADKAFADRPEVQAQLKTRIRSMASLK